MVANLKVNFETKQIPSERDLECGGVSCVRNISYQNIIFGSREVISYYPRKR